MGLGPVGAADALSPPPTTTGRAMERTWKIRNERISSQEAWYNPTCYSGLTSEGKGGLGGAACLGRVCASPLSLSLRNGRIESKESMSGILVVSKKNKTKPEVKPTITHESVGVPPLEVTPAGSSFLRKAAPSAMTKKT